MNCPGSHKNQSKIRIPISSLSVSLDYKIRLFLRSFVSHCTKYESSYFYGPTVYEDITDGPKIALSAKYRLHGKSI